MSNFINIFGLFKEQLIEISFGHEIVFVDLIEFFQEILLLHDQADHFVGYIVPDLLNYLFELVRVIGCVL